MLLRLNAKNPDLIFRIGLVAFLVANVFAYVVRHTSAIRESVADPVSGFLYGVAIATLLIGIRLRAKAGGRPPGGSART
jgi:uncharacterized membrane protein YhhN